MSFSPEHTASRAEVRAWIAGAMPPHLREKAEVDGPFERGEVLEHRAVDGFIETELAQSTGILAALEVGAAGADARCGAFSVTDEHDLALDFDFERERALSTLFGDEGFRLAHFASLPAFTAGL